MGNVKLMLKPSRSSQGKWALLSAILIACGASGSAAGEREGQWSALSRTAQSITGDIILSPTRLRAETAEFRLGPGVDQLQFVGVLGRVPARALPVRSPRNPTMLNGNRICRGPVRWFVVALTRDGDLEIDAFEGKAMPRSVRSAGFCGAFFYSRFGA